MKRITARLVLFVLINTVFLSLLFAEDDFIIEIPDESENKDTDIGDNEKSSQNIFDRFLHNGKGKIKTRYSWFFHDLDVAAGADPEPDSQSHIIEQYITYSSFLEQGFFRFDLSTRISIGNQKYTYSSGFEDIDEWELQDWFRDANNRRHYFDIEEIYVSLFFPICDIIIGKKIFVNSLSSLYSPADIYKAIDTHDPFDPRESGKTQVQANFFTGDFIFTVLIWPYYEGGKEFSPLSRWGYYRSLHEIAEGKIISAMLTIDEKIYPPIAFENISYLGKLKGTVWGWDFFISAFHGLAGNTVSRITGTIPLIMKESEVVPVFQVTGGFSTTISKLELHAETLYNYTYELRDDHYIRYVGGFRYTFDELSGLMDKIEVTCEYAREDIFEKQDNPDYTDSTADRRFFKSDLLANILFQFIPKWKLNVYGQYTITDSGFIISGDLGYRIVDDLEISLGAQFFIAPEASAFYWWRDNSRFVVQLTLDY